MVETIIELLEEKSLDYKQLKSKLHLEDILLDSLLKKMLKDGKIVYFNDKYILTSKTRFKKGTVEIKKNKTVIVNLDDGDEVIISNPENLNDGDIVLVNVDPRYRSIDDKYGTIYKILERNNTPIVGEVIIKNNTHYIKNDNKLIPLLGNDLSNVTSGYMVLTKMSDNGKAVKLIKVIGHKEDIDMAVEPYMYQYGFSAKFSKEVEEEAKKIPLFLTEEKINELLTKENFVDLRKYKLFTIDGADTKDIDDSVSIKQNLDGSYTLITSIALPAYYIKRGSYIFQDIIERGNSAYFDGSVAPMNHPRLSNEICSLNEDSDRLALSYFVTINQNGKIIKTDIKKSIINSKKKMNYDKVNEFLEDGIVPEGYEKFVNELNLLNGLSKKIDRILKKKGYLDFYSPETNIKKDEYGNRKFEKRIQRSGEKLIEKAMVITNIAGTEFLESKGLRILYRNHGEPNQRKLYNIMRFIAKKYPFKLKERYSSSDIQKVLKLIKGTKEEKVFNNYLIRCQSRAKFSHINEGHYGLATEKYAMHTSAIRRGEDFVDQSIILDWMEHGVEYTNKLWADDLEEYAKRFTEREIAADKLEQVVLKNRLAEELKNHIGEYHKGIISSVTEYGIYVEIDEMYEGFISKEKLGRKIKYYPDDFTLENKETYEKFSLGDEIDIVIAKVNEDFNVDFDYIANNKLIYGEEYEEKKGKIKKKTL